MKLNEGFYCDLEDMILKGKLVCKAIRNGETEEIPIVMSAWTEKKGVCEIYVEV